MLRRLTTATTLAMVIAGATSVQGHQATGVATRYDDFNRLSVQQRREQFGRMSPKEKALTVRTHAERWIAANHARLGSSQVRLLREAAASLTPEFYSTPTDPRALKREREVEASMRCRVNPDVAAAAFDVFDTSPLPASQSRWTYPSLRLDPIDGQAARPLERQIRPTGIHGLQHEDRDAMVRISAGLLPV